MHEPIALFVYPVLERGLELRRRLCSGESPSIQVEQATLEDLICREPELAESPTPDSLNREADSAPWPGTRTPSKSIEEIRYALTCWLDELFILWSPWDSEWTENKLEVRLFGSNDRAWRFWERSNAAEQLPRPDVLEVFFLCVSLGFRGEPPSSIDEWLDRVRARLEVSAPGPNVAALDPPCDVPPLVGRDRFRSMVLAAGIVAILSIPALSLILVTW